VQHTATLLASPLCKILSPPQYRTCLMHALQSLRNLLQPLLSSIPKFADEVQKVCPRHQIYGLLSTKLTTLLDTADF